MQRSKEEIAEIERHKYLLSEKQGHDVGWEFAEQDWLENYADEWRSTSESNHTCPDAALAPASETASPTSTATVAVADPPAEPKTIHRIDSVSPWKRWLNRVFSRT